MEMAEKTPPRPMGLTLAVGIAGGLMPTMASLTTREFLLLVDASPLFLLGYFARVVILMMIGASTALMSRDENVVSPGSSRSRWQRRRWPP
jgi:hypothetical protein